MRHIIVVLELPRTTFTPSNLPTYNLETSLIKFKLTTHLK